MCLMTHMAFLSRAKAMRLSVRQLKKLMVQGTGKVLTIFWMKWVALLLRHSSQNFSFTAPTAQLNYQGRVNSPMKAWRVWVPCLLQTSSGRSGQTTCSSCSRWQGEHTVNSFCTMQLPYSCLISSDSLGVICSMTDSMSAGAHSPRNCWNTRDCVLFLTYYMRVLLCTSFCRLTGLDFSSSPEEPPESRLYRNCFEVRGVEVLSVQSLPMAVSFSSSKSSMLPLPTMTVSSSISSKSSGSGTDSPCTLANGNGPSNLNLYLKFILSTTSRMAFSSLTISKSTVTSSELATLRPPFLQSLSGRYLVNLCWLCLFPTSLTLTVSEQSVQGSATTFGKKLSVFYSRNTTSIRPFVRVARLLTLSSGLSPMGCVRAISTRKLRFSLMLIGYSLCLLLFAAKLKVFCWVSTVLISYSGLLPRHQWWMRYCWSLLSLQVAKLAPSDTIFRQSGQRGEWVRKEEGQGWWVRRFEMTSANYWQTSSRLGIRVGGRRKPPSTGAERVGITPKAERSISGSRNSEQSEINIDYLLEAGRLNLKKSLLTRMFHPSRSTVPQQASLRLLTGNDMAILDQFYVF